MQPINGASDPETNYQEFFTKWQEIRSTQLHELLNTSKITNPPPKDSFICSLVQREVTHYEDYYKAKSSYAKGDVFPVLTPNWNTPLEDAFTWVGGWRPSTAFHLLYSVSGLQLEAKLTELLSGGKTDDLGGLSSAQMVLIDTLQCSTIKEERNITEKMAKQQEKVADGDMVNLSHVITESIRMHGDIANDFMDAEDRVDSAIKGKEEGFENILGSADDLRMRTLKGVIDILSPIQAVHFLIAAAELQLRLHDWGKEKEEKQMAAQQQLLPTPTAAEAS